MNDNSFQQVLSAIRNYYARYRNPISIAHLNILMRPMKSKDVKKQVVYLKQNNAIDFSYNDMMITPILSKEEVEYIEAKPVGMDETKIKDCIKVFFIRNSTYPTSSNIIETFIKMFGIPNAKDPDRFVRELFEDGKLKRTDDNRYYFDGMNLPMVGLRRFTAL